MDAKPTISQGTHFAFTAAGYRCQTCYMRLWLVVLAVLVSLVGFLGCASKSARLVGLWKAEPIKPQSSPNFADAARSSMLSMVTQNLQVEFNKEGKVKVGAGIGWGTGSYKWEGDVLVITFDGPMPQQPLKFKFEGERLVQQTDFPSDPKIELVKQPAK